MQVLLQDQRSSDYFFASFFEKLPGFHFEKIHWVIWVGTYNTHQTHEPFRIILDSSHHPATIRKLTCYIMLRYKNHSNEGAFCIFVETIWVPIMPTLKRGHPKPELHTPCHELSTIPWLAYYNQLFDIFAYYLQSYHYIQLSNHLF